MGAVRHRRRSAGDDAPDTGDARRWRGERGMAMVTGLVLLFAFTAGGVVWLARDVNRVVSNQTAAQSIAFQAARAGAQQIEAGSLRRAEVRVDAGRAATAARETAADLFSGYGVSGRVTDVRVDPDGRVQVTVQVDDPAGQVTGVGAARPEVGP